MICRGPECGERRGAAGLASVFREALARHGGAEAELAWQSCFGRCTQGPNVLVRDLVAAPAIGSGFATLPGPRGVTALYNRVDPGRVETVVREHVVGGQVARDLVEQPALTPRIPRTSTKDS